jgi:3'-phosphoadenosine 5'-phosphosulfate sulfotransferase (PAPS reductase)/FAD synthetase
VIPLRDPFKIVGPTCISFSGGRTSAYMLWRVLQSNGGGLPAEARVLFCNTGMEEEATLRFVRDCGKRFGVDITWLEYALHDTAGVSAMQTSFERASRHGGPFEDVIRQRSGMLPTQVTRYCSSELKTRTMHRHLRRLGWEEWDTFIGIRADEPRRVAKFRANPSPETKSEEVHMPLADAGITKHAVSTFWRTMPFDLELPNVGGVTPAGNCSLCFLKPTLRIMSLIAEKPERATWWIAQEEKSKATAKTPYGARFADDRPSYAAMANTVSVQTDFIGHDNEEAIACFCGE